MRNLKATNLKTAMIANCNVMMGNWKSLDTPMGMLLQIELLVVFTAFLLLFLVAFGSWRRRYSNGMIRFVIFLAYTLSTYIITYALGLMQDAPFRNELFPVWAMFLMLVLAAADSISAYSLEDNEQWRTYYWQISLKLIWVIVLIAFYFRHDSEAMVATVFLILVLLLTSDQRGRALRAASQHSLEKDSKVYADYMSEEHKRAERNPVSMSGYTYLVMGEQWNLLFQGGFRAALRLLRIRKAARAPHYRTQLRETFLITIDKVWKCNGRLLNSQGDPRNELKDKCLSFALFKLLRLRYANYTLPQEAHEKTWNLIRDGLLLQDDGYKRAFRVVEDELTFLYDFFYTKYGIMFRPGWCLYKLSEFIYVVLGIGTTTSLLKHYKRPISNYRIATLPNGLSVEVLVTSLMIISFVVVEVIQFVFMASSEWVKVTLICYYVKMWPCLKNVTIERIIRWICAVRWINPWERKLGQYSFLQSYVESYPCKPFCLLIDKIMAAYVDRTRHGRKQSRSIPLPEEVKKAVFDALKSNCHRKLTNGSLTKNKVPHQLLWACQLETQTQVIMVWHIATSFCEHQKPVISALPGRTDFLVATSLSKYLAYLVALAPRLLPDHPYVAENIFNQAIMEARLFFGRCEKMEDRLKKMATSGSSEHEITVIERGAALGNQLVNSVEDGKIWKILADFWSELVLYVAPSDNAKAHAEHLARGGEFVTHLWALLSHAGIERNSPTKPPDPLQRSNSI